MGLDNNEKTAYVKPGDRVRMLKTTDWWYAGDEALVYSTSGQAYFGGNPRVNCDGRWFVVTDMCDDPSHLYDLEILERGCPIPEAISSI